MSTFWSIAAALYFLAAFSVTALFFAVIRRAPKGLETRLLAVTLFALIYHYLFFAGDAFLRSEPAAQSRYTLWAAAGQASLILFWTLLCIFLFAVIRKRIDKLSREINVISALVMVFFITAYTMFASARIIWALYTGVPETRLQHYLEILITSLGGFGVFFSFPPAYLISAPGRMMPEMPLFLDWVSVPRARQLTTMQIVQYPVRTIQSHPFSIRDFKALSAAIATVLAVVVTFFVTAPTPLSLSLALVVRLSLLISMLSVIYFQARFTFFDVILKRGVISVLLAGILLVCTYRLLPASVTPPQKTVFCVGATLFTSLWTRVSETAENKFSQIIFRRPNYQVELANISEEMAKCKTVAALETLVPTQLRQLLHTNTAAYGVAPIPQASAIVRIGAATRIRGYLSLGERDRAQPYGSEDLTFLEAVAAQFAAQLESLNAQHSAQLAATAELRALRAQINPHFLFNTLNSVAEMAKGIPAVERTILNLARVFRNTLESSLYDRIPLKDDLAAVRALLEIESVRFEHKLQFTINAANSVLETAIPPLLIQPLVENAIKHGLAQKLTVGFIQVNAEKTVAGIRISVIDDGVGFDAANIGSDSVGIANVRSRIEHEGGAFSLISVPGQGTTVSFELNS